VNEALGWVRWLEVRSIDAQYGKVEMKHLYFR